MKKTLLSTAILLFVLATTSVAQVTGNNEVVTVEQARNMNDDSPVTLEGFIIESLGDDEYTFQDNTGKIEVEIDNDIFNPNDVDPKSRIRIQGEVDEDDSERTIDVEKLNFISDNR